MELIIFLCVSAVAVGLVFYMAQKAAVRSLLQQKDKTAALHSALQNRRLASLPIIKRLLAEGAKVNHVGEFGRPPLVAALSQRCPLPVIRTLIEAGALVNGSGDLLKNPLIAALFYCNSPDVISELLKAGADPDVRMEDGSSLLMIAACFYHQETILDLFLDKGNKLDDQNFEGMTALSAAAAYGRSAKNIKKLAALGADQDIADHAGKTAADYLRGNWRFCWRQDLRRLLPRAKKKHSKKLKK